MQSGNRNSVSTDCGVGIKQNSWQVTVGIWIGAKPIYLLGRWRYTNNSILLWKMYMTSGHNLPLMQEIKKE